MLKRFSKLQLLLERFRERYRRKIRGKYKERSEIARKIQGTFGNRLENTKNFGNFCGMDEDILELWGRNVRGYGGGVFWAMGEGYGGGIFGLWLRMFGLRMGNVWANDGEYSINR